MDLEQEIDRLYGLAPTDFTPARDALAKELRAERERAAAARVKELRKPTAAAAVVNRLAREERMNVRALLTAGERLRGAQAKLLRGGAPDDVHKAAADERKAIAALLAAGRKQGAGEAVLRRVESTLRAAAIDEDARRQLEEGRLTRELEPVGFGLAGMPTPTRKRKPRPPRPDPKEKKKREELARAKAKVEGAEKRAADAARALEDAEEQLRRLERSNR